MLHSVIAELRSQPMRRVITRTVTTITTVTTTITWNEETSLPPDADAAVAEEPGENPAEPSSAEDRSSPEDDPAAAA
jgi:hypothetical protein